MKTFENKTNRHFYSGVPCMDGTDPSGLQSRSLSSTQDAPGISRFRRKKAQAASARSRTPGRRSTAGPPSNEIFSRRAAQSRCSWRCSSLPDPHFTRRKRL